MASGSGGYHPKADDEEIIEIDAYHNQNHQDSTQPCHHYFSTAFAKITLIFLTVALVCLALNTSTYPTGFVQRTYLFSAPKDGSIPGHLSSPSTGNTVQQSVSALSYNTEVRVFIDSIFGNLQQKVCMHSIC